MVNARAEKFKRPDPFLFLNILVLLSLGLLILSSVSAAFSMEKFQDPAYVIKHQLLFGFLPGGLLGLIAYFLPLERIKKLSFAFFLLTLFSVGLLLVSHLGLKFLGAARWLNLGNFVFQPSEMLKLGFILYLALWFSRQGVEKRFSDGKLSERLKPLGPFLVLLLAVATLLALQPDVGTLSVVALVAALMFFLAKTPLWQNLLLWGVGVAGFLLLIKIAPYRLNRLLVFLHPDIDPMGIGYQLKQSLITIGSGGFFGVGLGLSGQKFGFLPQTIGDAIFPVFAEEAGFVGASFLLILFLAFFWRSLKVSFSSHDSFSQLAGAGIALWISVQAFINICSMTGLSPLTGIPLPLISYGGSHLVAELIGLGVLLNISRTAN